MKSVNEETVSMLAASALELLLSMKSMCSSFCIQSAVAVEGCIEHGVITNLVESVDRVRLLCHVDKRVEFGLF